MEVVAADHGLQADGGVDGLMMAERVKNGAKADKSNSKAVVEAVAPPKKIHVYPEQLTKIAKVVAASMAVADAEHIPTPTSTTLFDKRNARFLASQKAGLNCWWV